MLYIKCTTYIPTYMHNTNTNLSKGRNHKVMWAQTILYQCWAWSMTTQWLWRDEVMCMHRNVSWLGGGLVHAAIAWGCKHGNHVGRKEAHTCMSKCTNQCQSDLLITKYTNSWFIVSRSVMHVQLMINIQQVGTEMLYNIYNCCAHEWACQSLVLDHNKWPMLWD